MLVDSFRSKWANSGCTIMADSLIDQGQRTLINFLVYCPAGVVFVKSVDASDAVKHAPTLCNLFLEIVELVGPKNVVHLVTKNEANYLAAGMMLYEKYPNIYWSPCAMHCLDLILNDIATVDHVACITFRSPKVTSFLYNNMLLLAWLRKRPDWKEIVRPAVTHSATTFITLKSLHDHKHDLQALVTSTNFTGHRLSKSAAAKVVSSIILDNKFWDDCLTTVKVAAPFIRLLRIVHSEKPSLGFVYEGICRAEKAIENILKKRIYRPSTNIIWERWDKHLCHNIYTAAYFLNPALRYDEDFVENLEVMNGLLDTLKKPDICPNGLKALNEIRLYRDRLGSFSQPSALSRAKTMRPDEWWRLFGHNAPNLQQLAIRLLSQTASSLGCERKWSFFERLHTKNRNRLEHQRLKDRVYVIYNLRLKNRLHHKRTNDPIDYECIDKTDFWVIEEEAPSELTSEDIDHAIYQDEAAPIFNNHGNCSQDGGEDDEFDFADQLDFGSFIGVGDSSSDSKDGYGLRVGGHDEDRQC
ncbi:DUF659 domain-containing protein [Quillaja saponaria]|uniref:DUF659 domain-containing protein n=1 Tax=Quillaja saponaria TaxID=32244 RepID=A0AAD7PX70_QUISA|nr:DUF659 domain-containing protein [Quillaja saponaria]